MEMKTCYMFNQLRDVANMLDDAMYLLGEGIVSKHSLEDPQRIDIPHQSLKSVYVTCKKQHGKSGAGSREYDYYDQLDEILGSTSMEGLDNFNEGIIPKALTIELDPSNSYEEIDKFMVGSAASSAGASGCNTTQRSSYRKRRRSELDVYLEHQNSLMRAFFHRQEQREETANRMRERELNTMVTVFTSAIDKLINSPLRPPPPMYSFMPPFLNSPSSRSPCFFYPLYTTLRIIVCITTYKLLPCSTFHIVIFCLSDGMQDRPVKLKVFQSLQCRRYSLDEFVGIGRVCCDCNGRLNSMSVLLESFDGRTVPLDVSQVETCSLFPGQVIAVKGGNPLGSKLAAKQIYCDTTLPMPEKPSYSSDESVAAGPFTQSDTLTYEPLEDLVQYIIDHEPHVVILIGPFVDVSHPQIVEGMLAETFQSCFERIIESFMEPLKLLKVNVVLVPSFRDAHHQMVYPVPPFMLRKQFSNLTLASDPCMLDINGIVIGVTSADVLLNLSKEEIFHGGLKSSDRLGRIASHILHQRNFYPLYPAAEEVNLDVELWGKYCFMHVTPNILILPSDLRCFIKNLNNCVTVNPERLAKGVVGGSFARLEVSCVNGKVSVAAQVVKI
ncbi:hypothetical protein C0J52_09691 [Blattella germanica]|nr:hypothetical protein C0J52_09691 [Blattella germanica]